MKAQRMSLAVLGMVLILSAFSSAAALQVEDIESRLKKDPDNKTLLLELGRLYHNLAFQKNDGRAIEEGDRHLTRLLVIDPENAAAMVYLGSIKTLKAQSCQDRPWEAMEFLQEGFTLMDKAVQIAPAQAEVRFLRAVNSVNVPEAFGRLSVALEDFKALDELAQNNPSCLSRGMLSASHYFYGLALLKIGDTDEAAKAFRRAVDTDPQSSFAGQARDQLSSLEKK
ncbi:MAG: tetratricopeptide repeat protein [Candidatus Aminicenantales bacterium]